MYFPFSLKELIIKGSIVHVSALSSISKTKQKVMVTEAQTSCVSFGWYIEISCSFVMCHILEELTPALCLEANPHQKA